MPVNGVNSNERNYVNAMNGTTGKKYNAVFGDSNEDQLTVNDFFQMMVTQLTNQDFMNPVDDTQYLAQMAQFSTMQEMVELSKFSKQNYIMSMLGKQVTVDKTSVSGAVSRVTGKVEKIAFENDDFILYVDGAPYSISKVKQVETESTSTSASSSDKTESSEEVDKSGKEA